MYPYIHKRDVYVHKRDVYVHKREVYTDKMYAIAYLPSQKGQRSEEDEKYRSLLQQRPMKKKIFCKRDLFMST